MGDTAATGSSANIAKSDGLADRVVLRRRWWWWYV